jgi:DNA (cytosine-5)-methyltransferase 1
MTYFSAFSGAGGFELALTGHDCVGFSEIDPFATAVYRYHFPHHHAYGDITTLGPQTLAPFDLLVAGFPCQAFSIAGRRRGFADARGALFFDLARLIAARTPRLLLLENVRGLLSHAEGQTYTRVLATLDDLGYDCQWEVCNAHDTVPQNRARLFIVGHRRGTRRPEVFPLDTRSARISVTPVTRVRDRWRTRTDVTTIDASYAKGIDQHGARTALLLQRSRGNNRGGALRVAPTVTRGAGDGNLALARGARVRRLTPRECERLMSWPDDWTRYGVGADGQVVALSDTQRYRLCGNGVVSASVRPIVARLEHRTQ